MEKLKKRATEFIEKNINYLVLLADVVIFVFIVMFLGLVFYKLISNVKNELLNYILTIIVIFFIVILSFLKSIMERVAKEKNLEKQSKGEDNEIVHQNFGSF